MLEHRSAGLTSPYLPKQVRALDARTGEEKVAVGGPVLSQSLCTLTLHIILANLVAWLGPPVRREREGVPAVADTLNQGRKPEQGKELTQECRQLSSLRVLSASENNVYDKGPESPRRERINCRMFRMGC